MATRAELAEAVLEELITEDSHQAPNAGDSEAVLRRYDRKHANLTDDNLADWAVSGEIPDGAMTGLTKIIAYECRMMFGREDLGTDYRDEGERDLRKFMHDRPTYEPVKADYL